MAEYPVQRTKDAHWSWFRLGLGGLLLAAVIVAQLLDRDEGPDVPWGLGGEGVPSTRDNFSVALSEASNWHADAILTDFSVHMSGEPFISYGFVSRSDSTTELVVRVTPLGREPVVETKSYQFSESRIAALPTIPNDVFLTLLDSKEAYQIAMSDTTRQFLARLPSTNYGFLQLQYFDTPRGRDLAWRAGFGDLLKGTIELLIDARTGEILDTTINEHNPVLVSTSDGSLRGPSAIELLKKASAQIEGWETDWRMEEFTITFRLSEDPRPWEAEIWAYSRDDPPRILSMEFTEGQEDAQHQERPCPEGGCSRTDLIERQDWSLDSVEAVAIALDRGGRKFILRRKEGSFDMFVSLGPDRLYPGLVWHVTIWDNTELPPSLLLITIDSKTGKTLGVVRAP